MKKALACILSMLLMLTMLPTVALAAGATQVGSASDLANAISSAGSGDTIELAADITGIEQMVIDKAITINMKGFSISGNPSTGTAFKVVAGGDLTLTNTAGTLSKLLVGAGEADEYNYEGIRIAGGGKTTVGANVSIETGLPVFIFGNGTPGSAQLDVYGKLQVSAPISDTDAYAAIQGNGSAGKGGTVINIYAGAEVINPFSHAMYIPQSGEVNISGGAISGKASAIAIKAGTLNISGGTLRATGPADLATEGYSNGVNASGCAIQVESNDAYSGNIVLSITGGTIVSDQGYALYEYLDAGNTATEVTSVSIADATLQSSQAAINSTSNGSGMLISQQLSNAAGEKITIAPSVVFQASVASDSAESEVKASIDPTFMIIIPTAVDFGTLAKNSGTKTKDFNVAASGVLIEDGAKIAVSVESAFVMKDKDGTGNIDLAYVLNNSEDPVLTAAVFANFVENRTEGGTVTVDTAAITKAGSYKGTMVFGISYVPPTLEG